MTTRPTAPPPPPPALTPANLTPVQAALTNYQAILAELGMTFLERDDAVRVAGVAVITRKHPVFIGQPGTAKSALITAFAERINPPGGTGLSTFLWLMTRFTTPEELFGPVSIAGLKQDDYRRITTGKLPEAAFVFLDEVFKANSAILNALLTVMNERQFDNGSQRLSIPLISLFGASNELPQGEDLAALWDRFALRVVVEYVSDSGFARLLRLAAATAPPTTITQADLAALQALVPAIPIPNTVLDALAQLRKDLAGKGITASDRRWLWMLDLMRGHALIEGRGLVEEDDLIILRDSLWQTPEQRQDIGRLAARLANPLNGKAVDLGDQASSIHEEAMRAQKAGLSDEEKMQSAVQANTKLKKVRNDLAALLEQATAQGRNPARIQKVQGQVQEMHAAVAGLIL